MSLCDWTQLIVLTVRAWLKLDNYSFHTVNLSIDKYPIHVELIHPFPQIFEFDNRENIMIVFNDINCELQNMNTIGD